jgi:hypothetical protein
MHRRVRVYAGCSRACSPAADLRLGGDGFDFGVGPEGLVAHSRSPAGLLVPAERQCRVEHVVAVDPDCAGPDLLGQGARRGDVLGPDARAVVLSPARRARTSPMAGSWLAGSGKLQPSMFHKL